ncbi:TldD/PmbA family protein [Pseudanabaena sp. PCC 6802]|uniref:TldD/PmbA family protein n=1 Tax=Pseudanabaena sp. PCC 6802 TaxID=118173 RepID=UPI00034C1DCE|nr:TldD/PmbA family protein [Pseudanabaena sp. PCC 6802]
MSIANHLPEQLLELAVRNGATAAEVYLSSSISHPVYFESNRLKQLESTESAGLALRLWKDGRPGLAIAYGEVEPQTLVDRAIALSELNDLEEPNLTANTLSAYPRSYGSGVSVEQLIDWGQSAIERVQSAYPEVLCESQWDCTVETMRLVNSLGLDCGYDDSTLDGYVSAEWIRGDDFLNVWYGESDREQLRPEAIANQILQHLIWAQENAAAPNGKVPVLFTAKVADTLWGVVAAAMSGRQVQQKASPWTDKRNQPVIAAEFTLEQRPDFGVYSLPFDDEGTPTEAMTWIDRGILQDFYGDRRTAKELKLQPRGNGFRGGLGSYPSPGLFNLVVSPGQGSLVELIAFMSDGIIVDQILGGGPGISGDFSVNIDLGYRVKNGAIVGRVKDTMVTGNAYTALQNLIQLGGDNEWQGSIYLPSMIVDSLTVTSRN